jgi:hypothetical protein
MLRRIFEPPVCCLLPPSALGSGNSREWPRRGRVGADAAAGAVDTDDSLALKIEEGSGRGLASCATCSLTSEPLVCEWGGWGWRWDSDDGGEVSAEAADGIAEVGSKERCDGCAGVDVDVDSGSPAKETSLPSGKGGLSGRDILASCTERACVSGAEASMERDGVGTGSAVGRSKTDNVLHSIEKHRVGASTHLTGSCPA